MERCKHGASLLEAFHILVFVVRRAILPAAKEDPNPFEGQSANNGMVFFTFSRVVIDVVAGPLALADGEPGKLMEGLPVKLGAGLPEIDHSGFATAFGDRRNARKALNVAGQFEARTVSAKEGRQPRG